MIRKAGKLPGATVGLSYALEYGEDRSRSRLTRSIPASVSWWSTTCSRLVAPMSAGIRLLREQGAIVPAVAALIELTFLNGRSAWTCHARLWSPTTTELYRVTVTAPWITPLPGINGGELVGAGEAPVGRVVDPRVATTRCANTRRASGGRPANRSRTPAPPRLA